MGSLLDIKFRYVPHATDGHHSVAIGANLASVFIPPDAKSILMQATVNNVRFTLDGVTPTAAIGFALIAGYTPLLIEITEGMKIQIFGENAASIFQYCFGK